MVGIHKSLQPVLIEEYEEKFELIVIEICIANKEIRVISGYGPQESWKDEERMPFFVSLEEEIVKALAEGKSLIIEMDANSKLGKEFIENDPKPMSGNGKILSGIINRHELCVANGLKGKVNGVITRKRTTKISTEESAIDLVIVSSDMIEHVVNVHIDEEKLNVLTSITNTKKGVVKHESDHNFLTTNFDIKWSMQEKSKRVEIFNFKDIEGQRKFNKMTNESTKLSSLFNTNEPIEVQSKKFLI